MDCRGNFIFNRFLKREKYNSQYTKNENRCSQERFIARSEWEVDISTGELLFFMSDFINVIIIQ